MWYLIQTEEGKEQALIDRLREGGEEKIGARCFPLRREAVWRREGRCIPHIETLFPGCVFAAEDGEEDFAGRLEEAIRKTGAVSYCKRGAEQPDARLRGEAFLGGEPSKKTGDTVYPVVYPVREEDREILEQLLDGDREHVVRLSPVEVDEADEEKKIIGCGGALRHYREDIVKKRIRLRYVIVRLPFLGGLRDILLGIRLKGDREEAETA